MILIGHDPAKATLATHHRRRFATHIANAELGVHERFSTTTAGRGAESEAASRAFSERSTPVTRHLPDRLISREECGIRCDATRTSRKETRSRQAAVRPPTHPSAQCFVQRMDKRWILNTLRR